MTSTHVAVWGGDGGGGNNVQLSGAVMDLSSGLWEMMSDSPQSSPQSMAVTTDGSLLFTSHTPSLFDPRTQRWRQGWVMRIQKNPPLLVETPKHIVAIYLDGPRGTTNPVEVADRSGTRQGVLAPSPPFRIDYESSAAWVSSGAPGPGRIIVVQASGEHLALNLRTMKWTPMPSAPVEFVNRNLLVVYGRSRVTIVGVDQADKADETRKTSFASFNIATGKWNVGPVLNVDPSSFAPHFGSQRNPTQLLRAAFPDGSGLLLLSTHGAITTVQRYSDSGGFISVLPALPSPPSTAFVALPQGGVGALLQNGSWATICHRTT